MTRLARFLAGAGAALAIVLAVAAPASAHATLEKTDPASGTVLATAPTQVAVQFDEAVGVNADSLRVYSPTGARVDDGTTTEGAAPDIISVDLRSNLGRGTYTVAWHVISADTHPVSGAFTFSIGVPSRTTVNPNTIITRASWDEGVLFGIARWAAYLAYALFTGTVIFLAWCWPRGAATRPARRTVQAGWIALTAATIAQVLLQGVYASALPLTRAFDPSVVRGTLGTRFGEAAEIRLLLLLAIGVPLITLAVRRIDAMRITARLRTTIAALAYTIALAATWAMLGHASTGIQTPLAVVSDLVHLTAMAVWLGGLSVLALLVLRLKDKPRQAATAVVRFSPLAFASVTAIIVTGTYQAWRDVGSWHALFDDAYGRLILLKISGVLCLVALGYYARARIAKGLRPWIEAAGAHSAARVAIPAPSPASDELVAAKIPAHGLGGGGRGEADCIAAEHAPAPIAADEMEAGGRAALRRLRWSVTAETGIVIAVLAATSILVDSVPGRSASGIPGQPAATNTTVSFNTGTASGTVYVTVGPGVLGTNQPHILVENPAGQPYTPVEVTAEFDLPAKAIGPLPVALTDQGEAHYIGALTQLDFTGTWQLVLTIRSDAFDETTVRIPVTIVGSTTG